MMFLSVNDSGSGPLRRVELKNGLVFGRHPECEVALADPTVGRYATKIVEDAGAFYFEDMGSKNPTSVVDGPTLAQGARARLKPGLRILIGRTTIDVCDDDPQNDETYVGKPASVFDADRTAPAPAPARAAPPQVAPVQVAATVPPPVARPVPAAVPSAESLQQSADDDLGGRTIGMLDSKPLMLDLSIKAALENARPRLILTNEADRRSVAIALAETTIGRDAGDIQLNHGAVSSPHAKIRFNALLNTFQIEDLDSRNKTYLRGAALNPKMSQTLDPESHVQFGPIECVFVVDRDADNVLIRPALYANALKLLQGQNLVTKEQVERAEKTAATDKRHPGEVLLLSGAITAKQWTRAVEMAQGVASQEMLETRGGSKRKWLYVGLAVAIAAILYWVLKKPA